MILLIVALVAALASLALVAVVQLIYASSELSYYAQLGFAVATVAAIGFAAARFSLLGLVAVVLASATVATLMPVEASYFAFTSVTQTGPLHPGDVVPQAGDRSEFIVGMSQLWLIHALLQG